MSGGEGSGEPTPAERTPAGRTSADASLDGASLDDGSPPEPGPPDLTKVATWALRALRDRIRESDPHPGVTSAALAALNIRPPQSEAILAVLGGRSAETVAVTLDQVLAQREAHRIRDLEVVWTGPETTQALARDTASVVRELFRTARETVLIAGYSFDHGKELLRPLCEAIRDRGVRASIFLNTPAEETTDPAAERAAAAAVQRFVDDNWPDPRYLPALFYDPRTARKGPPWVSLHAKCLIVDRRRTLI
ncbi:MAG TPA: hypothetical protein RMF84_17055, partial [Polyangiaceae bacterium LLY-WYZ-14_1]|nr:hypothetical protein [Polyangiaceae bacterium LLY-WYZ-14_1]